MHRSNFQDAYFALSFRIRMIMRGKALVYRKKEKHGRFILSRTQCCLYSWPECQSTLFPHWFPEHQLSAYKLWDLPQEIVALWMLLNIFIYNICIIGKRISLQLHLTISALLETLQELRMPSNYDSPASEEASVLLCCHQAPFTGFWGEKTWKAPFVVLWGKIVH